MGAGQSAESPQTFDELIFERGNDDLSVEVHSAHHEDDNVTIFTYTSDSKHRVVIDNTQKAHKILRHPSILKFVTLSDSGDGTHVVTEPATPLCVCLDYVNSWEITVGLTKILEALNFLHTQAGFSHNNISMESIYITPDGDWKLARLDCARKLSENTVDHINKVGVLCDTNIFPPHDSSKKQAPTAHCRDMKGFGEVCEVLLEKLGDFDEELVSEFSDVVDLMLSEDSKSVPTAEEVITQPLLSNQLVLTLKFLEEITLKSPDEKKEFFSSLVDIVRQLPEVVTAKLLVRPLLRRFVVEDSVAYTKLLPCLLTPKNHENDEGLLSPKLYKQYLAPILYRLFTVKEYKIRKLLLDYFHSYCHLLDKKRLEKLVMPLILQGLHDTHDSIVAQSLVALSATVSVLGGALVIGTERREIFAESGATTNSINYEMEDCDETLGRNLTAVVGQVGAKKPRPKRQPRKPRERRPSQPRELKLGAKRITDIRDDSAPSSPTNATDLLDLPGISPTLESGAQASKSLDLDNHVSNGRCTANSTRGNFEGSEESSDSEDFEPLESLSSTSRRDDLLVTDNSAPVSSPPTKPAPTSPRSITNTSNQGKTNTGQARKGGTLKLSDAVPKKPVKKIDDDFSKLDIKSNIIKPSKELDFFADMAPNISTSKSRGDYSLPSRAEETRTSKSAPVNLAYSLAAGPLDAGDGWGGEEDGWDW